ncbi:MAG: hypothetical protein U0800_06980 [Isosphaeraceae bacterium]
MTPRRIILWTAALTPPVLLGALAFAHFREYPPLLFLLRASVAFLTALEAAYLVALAAIALGVPIALRIAAKRRGPSRTRAAKFVLLGCSLGISFALGEATAAILRAGERAGAAVPAGGFGASEEKTVNLAPLAPLPTTFPEPSPSRARSAW